MTAADLLAVLADGEFHSGQDLADQRGVSRTAIWKQIATLERQGLVIERVRGTGYRIPGGLDLLRREAIFERLSPQNAREISEFFLCGTIDSTNAELLRRGAPERGVAVCTAEQQSAGRGRRGRSWISPFAGSICLSLSRRFAGGTEDLGGLSLAVGVAVCRALEAHGLATVQLKWPNDVLLGGRKLAGILVEASGDLSGGVTAVVGVGINVALPEAARGAIDQPWTDLRSALDVPPSRSELIGSLLQALLPLLRDYEQQGFAAWREAWEALDAYRDQDVVIHQGSRRLAGTARGVDAQGALLLESASGLVTLHGGEVSLRPAAP